ncbi:hypothetical protein ACIBHX_17750 [Nonomuraea sp. NPDC050536]|uniref:hypothetical protein n=1 Tax=Nonomuraea sp. NPDC050536 TaxID=3364366 RepID=UPI0037CAB28D
MAGEATPKQWPVIFWAGVVVAEFGAVRPGFGDPWKPSAYAVTALLVALGVVTVWTVDHYLSEHNRQRLRLAGYLAGGLVLAHQFASTAYVTSLSRTGSLLLYGTAAVMAVWSHKAPQPARGTVLIAAGIAPERVRRLLRDGDTRAIYRAERATPELRELEERYGVRLVLGDEHDPRAKELVSASGLEREIPDIAQREVMIAGPRSFTRYVRGSLRRLAVQRVKRKKSV